MEASYNGHVEVVDKLLQHGATVDLQAQVIITPTCKYWSPRAVAIGAAIAAPIIIAYLTLY